MMGKGGRTPRSPVPSAPAAVVVVAAAVIVIAPRRSWVHGLHRDLGSGLGRRVEDLSPGVVLRPELHRGLHGDLGLLGKAVAAVGGRGAAVARGRRAVGGRRGTIGGGGAVGTPVRPVQVRVGLDLDHTIGTRAKRDKRRMEKMSRLKTLIVTVFFNMWTYVFISNFIESLICPYYNLTLFSLWQQHEI